MKRSVSSSVLERSRFNELVNQGIVAHSLEDYLSSLECFQFCGSNLPISRIFLLLLLARNCVVQDADQKSYDLKATYLRQLKKNLSSLFEKAEAGDVQAMYGLALCYEEGFVVKKKQEHALNWLKLAAQAGYAPAQYHLSQCYQKQHQQSSFLHWLNLAASQGHAGAEFSLGTFYEQKGNQQSQHIKRSVFYFQKAAQKGHLAAIVKLGGYLKIGKGVRKNTQQAFKLFQYAAKRRYPEGFYALGLAYEQGNLVKKNQSEAITHYHKAASSGHALAMNRLGECYQSGVGTKRDRVRALHFYRGSAQLGCARANYQLGRVFEKGLLNLEKDEKQSFHHYLSAAKHHHINSQIQVGQRYSKGVGVDQDQSLALFWLQKAAESNDRMTQYVLGQYYQDQSVFDNAVISNSLAIEWFKRAADQGLARAQYMLAVSYEESKGVDTDLNQAIKLYTQAADQGMGKAQLRLALVLKRVSNTSDKRFIDCYLQMVFSHENQLEVEKISSFGIKPTVNQVAALTAKTLSKTQLFDRAVSAYDLQQFREAFILFTILAGRGHYAGHLFLANMCEKGLGTELNEKMASTWQAIFTRYRTKIETDVQAGDRIANYIWGQCSLLGVVFTKQELLGLRALKTAGEKGLGSGFYRLGKCALQGMGMPKSYSAAEHFFRLSAELYYTPAIQAWKGLVAQHPALSQDFTNIKTWYTQAAQHGVASAQYYVAYYHRYGQQEFTHNAKRAFGFFEKAARKGHALAAFQLGYCYEYGIGTQKNLNEAISWYLQSASYNVVDAYLSLARLYSNKLSKSVSWQSPSEGLKWLKIAAKLGSPVGQHQLAVLGQDDLQYSTATIAHLKEAADRGFLLSQQQLAIHYSKEATVKRSVKAKARAYCYLQLVAAHGDVDAQKKLHESGFPLLVSERLRIASLALSNAALFYRAIALSHVKAYALAIPFFILLAARGHYGGFFYLSVFYQVGHHVEENQLLSNHWRESFLRQFDQVHQYAEQYDPIALYILGLNYARGLFSTRKIEKSMDYLTKGHQYDYPPASYLLGRFYEVGRHVEKSLLTAYGYYRQAAKQNYLPAIVALDNVAREQKQLLPGSHTLTPAVAVHGRFADEIKREVSQPVVFATAITRPVPTLFSVNRPIPQRQYPLHDAVRQGKDQLILDSLLEINPELLNTVDSSGKSPVEIAADMGDLERVKYLFKKGAQGDQLVLVSLAVSKQTKRAATTMQPTVHPVVWHATNATESADNGGLSGTRFINQSSGRNIPQLTSTTQSATLTNNIQQVFWHTSQSRLIPAPSNSSLELTDTRRSPSPEVKHRPPN